MFSITCLIELRVEGVTTATGLSVAREGMRVVSVPVSTRYYQRCFAGDFMIDETAALIRALVPLEDARSSFQIIRLSAASRL